VDAEDFGRLYEDIRNDAVRTVRAVLDLARDQAEEGVQDAAMYVLTHLDRFQTITPSYFKQLCVSRGKDFLRKEGRQHDRVAPVGGKEEVEAAEHAAEAQRRGRRLPEPESE
jgi:DNA-directed RNA polymerase specialized sigma24 family protein